jgi:hypothetical protein
MSEEKPNRKSSSDTQLNTKFTSQEDIKKINIIITYFKMRLFRKKVKLLIKKHKENYVIVTTLKDQKLKLVAFFPEDETKEYPVEYEPILDDSIAYVSRDDFKKRLLLKCNFVNDKNESIIDPKYNNEFNDGLFINVINLKKIKEKEEEREDDFQTFLETYFTSSNKLTKEMNDYFFKDTSMRVKRSKKRTLTATSGLKLKKLGSRVNSDNHIHSILKERPNKRIPSNKRISFGEVKKFEYYIDSKK